jgi:polysaccharide biosynthesis protein PslH
VANILYLVHRLPYPPSKGDKVRSYHLLKHLVKRHRVFLGTFIDDPEDEPHIAMLRTMCADLCVIRLNPRLAKLRSLGGLLSGEALTLRYYRSTALSNWVNITCQNRHIDTAVIFSSAMAQYVEDVSRLPTVIDFVDVDSAKWSEYAPRHRWPLSWLYQREAKLLLAYERRMAARVTRSFFVTDNEVALFGQLAPECAVRIETMCNGVDSDYFARDEGRPSPYSATEMPIVFTGAMDYLPNIDAVTWFAKAVLPGLRQHWPQARFHIVGRSPSDAVKTLAGEHVAVTGTVPDVRPYLQHAAVVVAPLRIARGIQNKVLEAMAMGRPVITSVDCAVAVDAEIGVELLTATNPDEYIAAISRILESPDLAATTGSAARLRVLERYSWEAHMNAVDRYLPTVSHRKS